jgi:predicted ATP-grasp superfamily ATP-dependent carboligase
MTDISMHQVMKNRSGLSSSLRIPFPAFEKYWMASDKIRLVRMAMELGVPVPDTVFIDSPEEIGKLKDSITYPVVLKPCSSLIETGNGVQKRGVRIIGSHDELRQEVRNNIAFSRPFMIQKIVRGEGIGVFCLFDKGKPVTTFSHRRIREKPPWGGVSVLSESTEVDPDARQFAIALLGALSWHGVAMVEFKRDITSGLPLLMEINARFWGSLQLSIDAGVDFPYLLFLQGSGQPIEEVDGYRYSRLRWLLGDLDHLIISLKSGRPLSNQGPAQRTRLSVIKDFFTEFLNQSQLETFRKEDPYPFLVELKDYFCNVLRRR